MTQCNPFTLTVQKLLRQRFFWLCGLAGLAALSGRVALAQMPTEELPGDPVVSAPANSPIVIEPRSAPESLEPKAPKAAEASVDSSDAFIDRTQYSLGATQREQPVVMVDRSTEKTLAAEPVATSTASVQVGSLSLSSSGISWKSGSTTPVGREYSTVREYYNRTVRPIGRLGNNIRLIFPLAIPAPITSLFGWRVHPITGDSRFHAGTDLGAPMGTPVLAAYAGQVALADFFGGYGLAIALNHNQNSQQTLYAHLSEIFVKPGEQVRQGTVIGRVGSTGASTGPHLHFEFRQLTTEGWVAMDAGTQLETAMAELVKALQVAQTPNQSAQARAKSAQVATSLSR